MKQIKKVVIIMALVAVFLILFYAATGYNSTAYRSYAKQGVLDLRSFDSRDQDMVLLSGEWEVYDKVLVTPEDQENHSSTYLSMDRSAIEANTPERTYALRILFSQPQDIDLLISEIKAFRLWVNGSEVQNYRFQGGAIQNQRMNTIRITRGMYRRAEGGYEIQLLLQVQNRISYRERPWRILLGNVENLNQVENLNLILNTFATGIFFLVVLYSFSLYRKKRTEEYLLYLGLLGINNTVHLLLDSNILTVVDTLGLDPGIWNKMIDLTVSFNLILIFMFCIKLFYARKFRRREKYFIWTVLGATLIFAALPPGLFVLTGNLSLYLIRALAPFNLVVIIIAYFRGKSNDMLLAGGFFFFFTALFEALVNTGYIDVGIISVLLNTSQYGYLMFITFGVLTAGNRFAGKFEEADRLALELESLNRHLEDKVQEKTLELQTSYDRIVDLQAKKQKFLMNISHDIRSPIFIINGYMDGILDGLVEDRDTLKKYLGRMKSKTEYLMRLVDELFLVAKLEDDTLKLNMEILNLGDLLKKVGSEFMSGRELSIVYNYPGNALKVRGDRQRLQQVMENILDNASKHAAGASRVSISLRQLEEDRAEISITDNGPGISGMDLPHIFERLYRGNPHQLQDSTGLGLSIAKEIIEKHQGTILAESAEGEGAMIVITLPLCIEGQEIVKEFVQ